MDYFCIEMAASKLAAYETGYEDERFEQIVSQTLHCIICTNVIKDPVMCERNEHLFCKACITRHLMYSQTCPTCMDPLTVKTLIQAPRGIRNLLAELKIRCEFFDRGCGKFVQLGDLERHVADCGFAPAICSNEGCQLEVNKQDLLHHETAVCELRRVQCHSCNDIRRDMDIVKVNMAAVNQKLATVEKNVVTIEEKLDRSEAKFDNLAIVVQSVVAQGNLVQQQLRKQEECNRRLEADNVEIKKRLIEVTKQLGRMTQQTLREVEAKDQRKAIVEEQRKAIAETDEMEKDPKLIIAGGRSLVRLNSVEEFSLTKRTWTQLQSMKEYRSGTSSVVYNNQLFVVGGRSKSIEKLSLNDVHNRYLPWENFPAELPGELAGHCSVVYNGRLIVIGGCDSGKDAYSDSIIEISLVPPYTSGLLATMSQTRCYHGVAIFGDKILIFGGREHFTSMLALRSVVMYDITKNECQELAPLPYSVYDMATVKCGDDNVMILGGTDNANKALNIVIMYNIKTQEIQNLPNMKYKRTGCAAAVVKDAVIVMGGQDKKGNYLKSVESFKFDRYSWEELPDMQIMRAWATAVAF